jgi:hypothetical protein
MKAQTSRSAGHYGNFAGEVENAREVVELDLFFGRHFVGSWTNLYREVGWLKLNCFPDGSWALRIDVAFLV